MPPAERKEPGRRLAGILAVLVHLVFIGLLVFGVSWQTKEAAPVVAELWSSLPAPKAAPQPEPEPAPRPEPKPEAQPVPKPEPKVEQPRPARAEIELKAKEKEKRRKEEEQKKVEAEKLRQAGLKRQEQEKLKQERALQEQQREAARQQQEAANALARQQAAAQDALIEQYKGRIRSKIKRFIMLPPDVPGNPQTDVMVILMPTGEVLDAKLTRGSGNPAYDSAVERAIYKAQPLPLPPDSSLFGRFRELHLNFRLNE